MVKSGIQMSCLSMMGTDGATEGRGCGAGKAHTVRKDFPASTCQATKTL